MTRKATRFRLSLTDLAQFPRLIDVRADTSTQYHRRTYRREGDADRMRQRERMSEAQAQARAAHADYARARAEAAQAEYIQEQARAAQAAQIGGLYDLTAIPFYLTVFLLLGYAVLTLLETITGMSL